MNEKELIENFETDWNTELTEVILLGKNGAVRRILFGEDDKIKYIG